MELASQQEGRGDLYDESVIDAVRAAERDAEAALHGDKELQNQRDMNAVASVARVRAVCATR
jgi:hypothetical protein